MLKVKLLDGTEIGYSFFHDQENRYTLCRLWKGDTLLASGMSFCHPKDNFNKCIGRKLALREALHCCFEYEERQNVWSQLLQRSPQTFMSSK